MTFKEKLKLEHPECINPHSAGGCKGCPCTYGYEDASDAHCTRTTRDISDERCTACWNREIPTKEKKLYITTAARTDTLTDKAFREAVNAFIIGEMKPALPWPPLSYGAPKVYIPDIKKVIFNDPATIVIWADGEKTVVKCQNNELYDPEKGLAMAITKRALGNKGNYFDEIKKWTKEYSPKPKMFTIKVGVTSEEAIEGIKKMGEAWKKHSRGRSDT